MDKQLIIDLLEIAARYGIPAVMDILASWSKDEVTSEDVAKLRLLIKKPDMYKNSGESD